MPIQITITDISGASPYDIYICDNPITVCTYIDTISGTSLPYSFEVPFYLEGLIDFNLKIVDNNDCEIISPFATGPKQFQNDDFFHFMGGVLYDFQ
jgi:hypothetical protein